MTYSYRIDARSAVAFVESLVNTLTIVDTTAWGGANPVINVSVVAPTGAVIHSVNGLAKNFTQVFPIAVDVDGNIIQGTYTVNTVWDGNAETTTFLVDYNPLNAALEVTGDGYASSFTAKDNTDYTGWSSVTRSLKVVCPAGSGMPDATTTGILVTIAPNIWSGDYVVSVECNFRLVVGSLTIYDGFVATVTESVEGVDETTLFTAVSTYFDEYVTLLSTAPKTAQSRLPEVLKVHSALHEYYRFIHVSDTLNAYLQVKEIYELLSIATVIAEITPFNITNPDHTHTNLNSVLALFENVGGDLLWNGVVIPLGESLGRVAMSNGNTPEFLESKLDNVTVANVNNKVTVKESYIAGLADDITIKWNNITKHFYAETSAQDYQKAIKLWEAGVSYNFDEWVYKSTFGTIDEVWISLVSGNQNFDPYNNPTKWRRAFFSLIAHNQNNDLYIPYLTSTKTAVTLGEIIAGKAGFNLNETDINRFVWTKTGAGNEIIQTIILPNTKADVVLTIKPTGAGSVTLKNQGSTYSFTGQLDLQGDDIVISQGEEYTFTFYAHLDQAAYITQIKSSTVRGAEDATPAGAEGDIQLNISSALGVAAGGVGKYAGNGAWTLGKNRLGVVGDNSFVSGMDNTASGASSTALGHSNTASGASSVVVGRGNQATGSSATALGGANVVSGVRASALGYTNTVSGDYSVATGSNNIILGDYCEVGGDNNRANSEDTVYTEIHGAQNTCVNSSYTEVHGRQNTVVSSYGEVHGWNNATEWNYVEVHGRGNTAGNDYTEVHGYGAVASEIGEYARSVGFISVIGDAHERIIQLKGRSADDRKIIMTPLGDVVAGYGITIPARTTISVTAQLVSTVESAVSDAVYFVTFGGYTTADTLYLSDINISGGDFGLGGELSDYFVISVSGLKLVIELQGKLTDRGTRGMAIVKIAQLKKITF